MNSLSGLPLTYTGISLFLSGFSVFAIIRLLSALRTGKDKFIPHFILVISAGLYIISNTLYIALFDYGLEKIFIIARELSQLLFLTAIPYPIYVV